MNAEELKKVLEDHKEWLLDSGKGNRAYLWGANLRGADLQRAYLQRAELQGADLQGAELWGANLRDANLQRANLRDANLQRANLRGADLRGANLQDANLENTMLPMYCKWFASVINNEKIKIGCETKTPKEWEKWLKGTEIFETPRNTPEFKQIEAVIRAHITYLKILNQ